LQQRTRRLASQDITSSRRNELVGWIRLPAPELLHGQGAGIIGYARAHPPGEPRFIEAVAVADGRGAAVGFLQRCRHVPPPGSQSSICALQSVYGTTVSRMR